MSDRDNRNNGPGRDPNSESDSISLSYSLTRADLFWYNIYFVRLLVVGSILFFILTIAVFIVTLYTPPGDLKTTLIWVIMGFGAGFSLCAGTIAAIILQIFFLKNESVSKAMSLRNYMIDASGIAVFNEQGRIVRAWKDIRRIIKTSHGFYVKTGDRISIVLPRRVFNTAKELALFEKFSEPVKKQ